jgi:type IV pilus assembly protein PilY1
VARRGQRPRQYFSAGDPTSLTRSLNSALLQIGAKLGAASAASTSSLQPVPGDNEVYVASSRPRNGTGDVLSYTIDPTTGSISATPTWSAKVQLARRQRPPAGRSITQTLGGLDAA